eukprot:1159953-Pelagomonas_calceolata.AAC.3
MGAHCKSMWHFTDLVPCPEWFQNGPEWFCVQNGSLPEWFRVQNGGISMTWIRVQKKMDSS